ncbi:MAG: hypothetical protein K6F53_00320 [Lachnospiraceae bacterium]|nr:hypothetical protein [Lachnospiraceae bacterium]
MDQYFQENRKLKSVSYNGRERKITDADIAGTVVVEYKLGGKHYTTLTEGRDYELVYLNNTNKGRATILLKGTGSAWEYEAGKTRSFVGNKKTGFTIVVESVMSLILKTLD